MPEDRYYIRFKGRVLGPLPPTKIHDMVRRGQITRQHELAPDGQNWSCAEEFEEFFPKATALTNAVSKSADAGAKRTEVLEWYAHFDGSNQGPVDEQGMRQWVEARKVRGETMIWKAGMAAWLEARVVRPEWFEASPASKKQNGAAERSGETEDGDLKAIALEMAKPRGWMLFLGICGIIFMIIFILSGGFSFMLSVAGPANAPLKIFSAMAYLLQLFVCLAGLYISTLLIRLTSKMQVLKLQPRWQGLSSVLSLYNQYWFTLGLTSVICLFLGLVVFFVGVLLVVVGGSISQ